MGSTSHGSSGESIGRCPDCETEISQSCVIIQYETGGGSHAYAECPGCRNVVHPG